MITFRIQRYFSSASGTLGKMFVTTPSSDIILDTIESRCPNDSKIYTGLCLPPGEYPMLTQRVLLNFEGEIRPYPWFYVDRVLGFPLASLVSWKGEEYIKGARIQYGRLNSINEMKDGYRAAKELFVLLKPYFDFENYEFTEDVKLIIEEREDMERVRARRRVVREDEEYVLPI